MLDGSDVMNSFRVKITQPEWGSVKNGIPFNIYGE